MKKSITTLTLFSLIAFAGILQGAVPAVGPSDAFLKGASQPIYIPVITEGESINVTMDEDGSPSPFTLTLHATDLDGDSLTWSIFSGATYGNPAVLNETGDFAGISYVPIANFNGTDSFVVRVIDGVDGGDTITVNVTINPRNDAPVNTAAPAVSGTHHVGQMLTAGTGTWNDSADLMPGTLSFSYQWQRADDATGSNAVDIVGATTTTYTVVVADSSKCLRFRVTATDDGEGLPATSATTVSTEWQPVTNISPAITEGTMISVTLDEDGSPSPFALTLHATDGDGDVLTWTISSAASHGNATVATGMGESQAIDYAPVPDYNTAAGGAESFVVEVSDGLGGSDTIIVDVTVNARNDGPINTVPGGQTTAEDTAVVFSSGAGNAISVADLDVAETVDGKLQVTLAVEHGSLTLATGANLTFITGDGSSDPIMTFHALPANLNNALNGLTYMPSADYSGSDSLNVTTADQGNTGAGGVLTDTDAVPITVTGVNDAPVVSGVTAPGVVDADTGETVYDFSVTFTDDSAVDVATLDNSDIYVTTPAAGTIAASFLSVDTPGNGTPRTATYRIVPPGGSWDVTDNGTYAIGIYGSQVGDDEAATVAASASIGTFSVALETIAPTVLNVTSSTANGSYRAGQAIMIQVAFSEAVNVNGSPRLTLETGSDDGIAGYSSGSGTSVLTFLYTVLVSHESGDLDYVGTGALGLNGATIRDAAGNAATLTLPVPGAAGSLSANKDIVIDTTAPAAPSAPDLQASSDTGTSSTDNITDDTTPTFDITSVESGATVTLTLVPVGGGEPIVVQGQVVAGGSTCTITVTSPLSPGTYTVTARQTDLAGNVSNASAAMAPSLHIAVAPSVTTQAATDVASSTATGNGTIVALGSPSPTAHGVVWNTTGSPTLADSATNEGGATSAGPFTSSLTGLSPNTPYYVRAYATSALTTVYGDQVTFTALQTFTLAYTAGPGGTITGTSPQTVDYGGSGMPVTAAPDTNYHFVSWSDDVTTATRTDINVTADISVTATFAADATAERAALIALYNATAGDSWTNNSGWKAEPHYSDGFAMPGTEGTWFGISASGLNILGVSLPANNLVGTLPSAIGDLPNLTALDLASNSLSGTLPSNLGNLTNLTLLRLNYNQLTGTLPAELWDLVNLQALDLSSNQLSGTLPAAIGSLTALRELLLYTNSFSGSLPDEMGSLVDLRTLALHENEFSGVLPAAIGGLTALQEVLLHDNQFTGSLPEAWGGLAALTFLRIEQNQLSGPIPTTFGNLSNLTALIAGNNQLSGELPIELADLHQLVTLDLRFNRLTGAIPAFLGGMTSLQVLYLQHNKNVEQSRIGFSGPIPPELGNLSSLRELLLHGNSLTGGIPVELGNLADLQLLYLNENELTGTIPSALGNLLNLMRLHLQVNQLTGSIPPELGSLSQLQILNVYGNKLAGPLPASLADLTALVPGSTDLGYNMLYTSDGALIAFLNSKDPDWAATQTIAPTEVTATSLDNAVILVSWLPITYTGDGGYYSVWLSETAGGPYDTLAGQTVGKTVSSVEVSGLTPGTRYYFVVRTHTDVHSANKNILDSGNSDEVTAVAWTQINVTISGNITLGGLPLVGVVMAGLPDGTVTDASGNYTGTEAAGWSGTVTPVLAGYAFTPASIPYTNVTTDETAQNYTATFLTYTISGTVTAGGTGLSGVTMSGLPGSPVTDGSGAYSATVDYGSSFTVTPTHSYYTFDPATQTYANVTADFPDQNYDASLIASTQRQALIAFYNSTNGDGWVVKSGWKTPPLYPDGFAMPGTEGSWLGLTVVSGTVTGISLYNNNLSGTIPPELGNLTGLQTLQLGYDPLTGTISTEWANLTNLQTLYISYTQLSGTIPSWLGTLNQLTTLRLEGNQLSGTIPPELGDLADLRMLYLSENQLSGSIPPELGNLTLLEGLTLDDNLLTGAIPPELGNLTSLTHLILRSNQLSGSIPPALGNLPNVQGLYLNSNQLSGMIPSELGNLSTLSSLELNANQLTGSIPAELGSLTDLAVLRLDSNQLSGPIPVSLANLTHLSSSYTDFGYNALYTSDEALITFLNSKDPDWASTQTIAPASVTATSLDNAVIMVSWLPVAYTADAGLTNVYMSQTEGGPYTLADSTSDKATTSLNVTGLTPAQRYYFVARTQTNAHANNANIVESGNSDEVTAVAWTQINVQITGTVTLDSAPLAGVVMNGLTGSPVTDASGIYTGTEAAGWSGTVTPTFAGYSFSPATRNYTNVTASQTAQDFAASAVVPTITVTSPNGGETWATGSTHAVTWNQTALTGSVTVDLYKGGVYLKTLGTAAATAGTFSWLIGTGETIAADYTVRVWQDGGVSDDSDADFALIRPLVRVDFNLDGQEDILWRYVGEGGYNRVWFLGDTGQGTLPLLLADAQMTDGLAENADLEATSKRTVSDPRYVGKIADKMRSSSAADLQDVFGSIRSRGMASVADPRNADGGSHSKPAVPAVADPRQMNMPITGASTPGISAELASVPTWLGGADVMAVGDLTWEIVGTGDFDNDTHVDILWRNNVSGMNVVWFMNGTEWSSSADLLPVDDQTWQIVGTGDFDKDGNVDILWRNSVSGENVVWYLNGTTWVGSAMLLGVSDQTWQIVGTGDFDRDGNVDILWRYNGAGGYNVVWHLNNATWIGSSDLIAVADTAWQIMGTGDYNKDGNIDILWRYNGAGGYNVIWYMNGVSWSESGDLLPVGDLTWRIVNR